MTQVNYGLKKIRMYFSDFGGCIAVGVLVFALSGCVYAPPPPPPGGVYYEAPYAYPEYPPYYGYGYGYGAPIGLEFGYGGRGGYGGYHGRWR